MVAVTSITVQSNGQTFNRGYYYNSEICIRHCKKIISINSQIQCLTVETENIYKKVFQIKLKAIGALLAIDFWSALLCHTIMSI